MNEQFKQSKQQLHDPLQDECYFVQGLPSHQQQSVQHQHQQHQPISTQQQQQQQMIPHANHPRTSGITLHSKHSSMSDLASIGIQRLPSITQFSASSSKYNFSGLTSPKQAPSHPDATSTDAHFSNSSHQKKRPIRVQSKNRFPSDFFRSDQIDNFALNALSSDDKSSSLQQGQIDINKIPIHPMKLSLPLRSDPEYINAINWSTPIKQSQQSQQHQQQYKFNETLGSQAKTFFDSSSKITTDTDNLINKQPHVNRHALRQSKSQVLGSPDSRLQQAQQQHEEQLGMMISTKNAKVPTHNPQQQSLNLQATSQFASHIRLGSPKASISYNPRMPLKTCLSPERTLGGIGESIGLQNILSPRQMATIMPTILPSNNDFGKPTKDKIKSMVKTTSTNRLNSANLNSNPKRVLNQDLKTNTNLHDAIGKNAFVGRQEKRNSSIISLTVAKESTASKVASAQPTLSAVGTIVQVQPKVKKTMAVVSAKTRQNSNTDLTHFKIPVNTINKKIKESSNSISSNPLVSQFQSNSAATQSSTSKITSVQIKKSKLRPQSASKFELTHIVGSENSNMQAEKQKNENNNKINYADHSMKGNGRAATEVQMEDYHPIDTEEHEEIAEVIKNRDVSGTAISEYINTSMINNDNSSYSTVLSPGRQQFEASPVLDLLHIAHSDSNSSSSHLPALELRQFHSEMTSEHHLLNNYNQTADFTLARNEQSQQQQQCGDESDDQHPSRYIGFNAAGDGFLQQKRAGKCQPKIALNLKESEKYRPFIIRKVSSQSSVRTKANSDMQTTGSPHSGSSSFRHFVFDFNKNTSASSSTNNQGSGGGGGVKSNLSTPTLLTSNECINSHEFSFSNS